MEIKNDKQTITYEGKQYYSKDLGYRMELGTDRVFVYKKDKIYVQDVKNNVKYTMEQEFDNGYRLSFIEEYIKMLYTNEEIKYDFKEVETKKYQLIELIIPSGGREFNKAVMYIDLKSSLPEQLIIYDDKDNERRKITYINFQCNPELQEDLFKVD
jgi:outer membrane lipoprotein-sorting protein